MTYLTMILNNIKQINTLPIKTQKFLENVNYLNLEFEIFINQIGINS